MGIGISISIFSISPIFFSFILGINLLIIHVITEELFKSLSRLTGDSVSIIISISIYAVLESIFKIFSIYSSNFKNFDFALMLSDIEEFGGIFFIAYISAILMHIATALIYAKVRNYWTALACAIFLHYVYNVAVEFL